MGTNTGLGIGIGIPFKNNALGGDKPYFPPELKARMIGVWTNYGKKNTDADRNIIKNKIPNAGGDLEILNAAYKLNSGFGEYKVDFLDWTINSPFINERTSFTFSSFNDTNNDIITVYQRVPAVVQSFKIKAKLRGRVLYRYYVNNGDTISVSYYEVKEGINILPDSVDPTSVNGKAGFVLKGLSSIKVEQIPSFEGAFVTDGVNDLITSAKTVQEMGITDEITVVSMIHKISSDNNWSNLIGELKGNHTFVANRGINTDKTGIYGYTYNYNENAIVINNILGDKNDYIVRTSTSLGLDNKYYVTGFRSAGIIQNISQIAWYWTFIANRVLTTDEINQVIAYYNLDRTLRPDILCNTIKQGIANENHAEFGDKLIDFSGNGRDIQLNNIAWKGDSGIGKYNFSNINIIASNRFEGAVTTNKCHFTKKLTNTTNNFCDLIVISPNEPIKFKVSGLSDGRKLFVANKSGSGSNYNFDNGEHEVSLSFSEGVGQNNPFGVTGDIGDIDVTVEFIPSHAGALCLDGVNDFGKVTGMPVYKDYTVVTDREIFANIGAILSKNNPGAFVETAGNSVYSFGQATSGLNFISTRSISYLSKYSYCGQSITAGAAEDETDMWLGTIRDNDSLFFNGAIYSLMSFPYSMSEFLIERQLKKHKLGTLYPDMVEFRPVITTNTEYNDVVYYAVSGATWTRIYEGEYIPIGQMISITINLKSVDEISKVVSSSLDNISIRKSSGTSNSFDIVANITSKSPQKINITIDEYIKYEDIVQPYPVVFQIKDRNTNQIYSWGDKIKVGSSIQLSQGEKPNLLSGLYSIQSYEYEGKRYSYNQLTNLNIILTKQSISLSCNKIWLLDDNEPKCILSPRLLRIPNSSYKILGYIPDISGHGNNGVIHNSAYAEGSGVNEDGSYQFDGVDDFVTIPTLSSGGKQVLMKVNSLNSDVNVIYDQRLPTNMKGTFAIMCDNNLAYSSWNTGQTYIDGILNKNIIGNQLVNITHNLTITNDGVTNNNSKSPFIGKSTDTEKHANMSLYDFMLFDDISTEDKIKELNEYVGIEAKVELPPYYWDAYGKTNLDGDKATIQQRGVAVGDYDLTNYNHAYEGMSGYNGYPVVFGANKTWTNKSNGYVTSITSNTIHITNVLNAGLALLYSYVKYNGNLQNIKEIPPFKIEIKGLEGKSKFIYKYLATSDATKETNLYLGNGTHELPKSFLPTEALVNDAVVGFSISPIEEGVTNFLSDITIEVLPEYENGLAYDGVSDFTDNKNIPILTDFTFIIKKEMLGLEINESMLVIKGDKVYNNGIGNAFILEHNSNGVNYAYSYGKLNQIKRDDSKIIYLTPESYNGNPIIKGENGDNLGLVLNRYWRGIIYKTILYSKTMSLLEINFLKNLMERDEIIDLNNPIFIKNE